MMQAFFYHNNTTSPIGFQWSSRTWKPSQWFQNSVNYGQVLVTIKINQITLETLNKALEQKGAKKWHDVAQDVYNSLIKNKTWTLTKLHPSIHVIGCKWVFNIKFKVDGQVDKHKAHLVKKGYSQVLGIYYIEIFSHVVKLSSLKKFIAFAAKYDYEVHQMSIKIAFLNGELEEDIHMRQPQGFIQTNKNNFVCKLNKCLYELKQSCELGLPT
jgi:hypothetical protein